MNVLNLFSSHKVVEINLSTGLRIGHMLSQHAYKDSTNKYVDNGNFFRLDKTNVDNVVLADNANAVGPYFLHYTEELFTTGLVDGLKYFTDEIVDGVCYPRCIALYVGDTFTTDNYTGTLSNASGYATVGKDGVLAVVDTAPASVTGPLFQAVKSTLPNGDPAVQFTVMSVD